MNIPKYFTPLALVPLLFLPLYSYAEEAAALDTTDADALSPLAGRPCTLSGVVSEVVSADGHVDVKFEGSLFTLRVPQNLVEELESAFGSGLEARLSGAKTTVQGKLLGQAPNFGMLLEKAEDLSAEEIESEFPVLAPGDLEEMRKHLGQIIVIEGKVRGVKGDSPTKNITFGEAGMVVAIPEDMVDEVEAALGGALSETVQGNSIRVQGEVTETKKETLCITIAAATDIKMEESSAGKEPTALKEPTEVVKAKDERRLEELAEDVNWVAVEGEVEEVKISDSDRCTLYFKRSLLKVAIGSDLMVELLAMFELDDSEDLPDALEGEDVRVIGRVEIPKEDFEIQVKELRQLIFSL